MVRRVGRTGLTRQNQEQEFASILALPPDRRITEMDIIWAERDSSRLMVVAWMMPHEGDESVLGRREAPGDPWHTDPRHLCQKWRRLAAHSA